MSRITFRAVFFAVNVMALVAVTFVDSRSSYDLTKMKWWRDLKPSQLKSKWNHHKRPPNLLAPGVLHFPSDSSKLYYFHQQVLYVKSNLSQFIPELSISSNHTRRVQG